MKNVDSTNQDSKYLKRSLDAMWELWTIAIHEIRTPLTVVTGMADIMLLSEESDPLSEKQFENLTRIRDANQDAWDAVTYLGEMYRLIVGQIDLQIEKIDLQSLIQEVTRPEINYNIPANLPEIWADRSLLRKALEEILSEATGVYYDVEKNQTIFALSFDDTWITFDITNHGEATEYFSGYPNPGLFVSQTIIEKHGGQLRYEKVGQALNIVFTLPIKYINREDAAYR